jgi:hypothetical protein
MIARTKPPFDVRSSLAWSTATWSSAAFLSFSLGRSAATDISSSANTFFFFFGDRRFAFRRRALCVRVLYFVQLVHTRKKKPHRLAVAREWKNLSSEFRP